MITVNEILELLSQGYEVFTRWHFNSVTDTGSIGHREYTTFKSKNGITTIA